jgi:hypothetical protein
LWVSSHPQIHFLQTLIKSIKRRMFLPFYILKLLLSECKSGMTQRMWPLLMVITAVLSVTWVSRLCFLEKGWNLSNRDRSGMGEAEPMS